MGLGPVGAALRSASGGSGTTGNASARSPGTRRHQKALEQEMQSLCHQHGWFVGFSLTLPRNGGVFASRFCETLVFPRLPCVCLRPVGSAAPPHGYSQESLGEKAEYL